MKEALETIGFPWICWIAIGLLVGCYFWLKFIFLPSMTHRHEKEMKEQSYKQEQFWHSEKQKAEEKSVDEQVKELKEKLSDTERALQAEKDANKLLKEQIEFYKDFLDKLTK